MAQRVELDAGLLLLRIGYAALLIGFHGWTRFFRALSYVQGNAWTFVGVVDRLGLPFPGVFAVLSALSESVAVLFVLAGLYTRWAALIITINFVVAFISEAAKGDPYELPGLYLLGAVVLMLTGPGRFALDSRRRRSAGARRAAA